jgi:hypothetical protein
MFDLEQAIADWRRRMLAAGIKSPAPLDELEAHLREDIERQVESGLDESEAFDLSVRKIGETHELKAEFAKINKIDGKAFMKNSQIVSKLSLAIVLLAAAWLIFSGAMIGRDLFPTDGLVSMRVSDGATVEVQHGVPTLLSHGIIYSGDQWHLAVIPAIVIPFAILTGFAIVGCRSLFQRQTA